MPERNAQSNDALPVALLRPTPRHVRPNANGIAVLATAIGLGVCGLWGASEIYKRAKASERHVTLFETASVATEAEVVGLQRRDNGRRWTIHYRYSDGHDGHTGSITVRRRGTDASRDPYVVGSRIPIRYLGPEPHESWMEGHRPAVQPVWPAFVVPAASIGAAMCLLFLVRRQSYLLTYGRPAKAFVTRVEKKRSDKGTFWRVHYEWTLLSGAKRQGRYNHGKKQPPALGTMIPIVYDRDNPARNSKYPMSLVALGQTSLFPFP